MIHHQHTSHLGQVSKRATCAARACSLLLAAAAFAPFPACTPPPPPAPIVLTGDQGQVRLWADWDDLDAALDVALERAELATLGTTRSDGERTWELTTIAGQPGQLTAQRDPLAPRDARGCEQLTLCATVHSPRGVEQAGRLLQAMAARLADLAGVESAPVR
jgi:hypothetical protein